MGLIFTRGDLKEVSEEVAKYKVCSLVLCLIIVPFNIFVKKNLNHQGKKIPIRRTIQIRVDSWCMMKL